MSFFTLGRSPKIGWLVFGVTAAGAAATGWAGLWTLATLALITNAYGMVSLTKNHVLVIGHWYPVWLKVKETQLRARDGGLEVSNGRYRSTIGFPEPAQLTALLEQAKTYGVTTD